MEKISVVRKRKNVVRKNVVLLVQALTALPVQALTALPAQALTALLVQALVVVLQVVHQAVFTRVMYVILGEIGIAEVVENVAIAISGAIGMIGNGIIVEIKDVVVNTNFKLINLKLYIIQ